jgi:uncharacterized protein (TIGR02145 family)
LYINYFKVNETPYGEFFGDQLGMIVNGKQRIEFDDLKIGITPYVEPVVEESEDAFIEEYIPEESLEDNDIVFHDGYGPGLKDLDGNKYKTVFIGSQEWMAENLKVSKYNDGTPIPNEKDGQHWINLQTGAWCYYDNLAANNLKFGKLYNWYALNPKSNGNKNVCPAGWHVPKIEEWRLLFDYLGADDRNFLAPAGGKMKQVGAAWVKPNAGANNSSLFAALPGGRRDWFDGSFIFSGEDGYWWSSSNKYDDQPTGFAYLIILMYKESGISIDDYEKWTGCSVRCIKD